MGHIMLPETLNRYVYCMSLPLKYVDITVTNTMGRKIMEYNPKETQWWITGFNPQFQDMKQEDLLAIGLVDFKDEPELWEGFRAKYLDNEKYREMTKEMLCFDKDNMKVFYRW